MRVGAAEEDALVGHGLEPAQRRRRRDRGGDAQTRYGNAKLGDLACSRSSSMSHAGSANRSFSKNRAQSAGTDDLANNVSGHPRNLGRRDDRNRPPRCFGPRRKSGDRRGGVARLADRSGRGRAMRRRRSFTSSWSWCGLRSKPFTAGISAACASRQARPFLPPHLRARRPREPRRRRRRARGMSRWAAPSTRPWRRSRG